MATVSIGALRQNLFCFTSYKRVRLLPSLPDSNVMKGLVLLNDLIYRTMMPSKQLGKFDFLTD
jgi:hypothetical protein